MFKRIAILLTILICASSALAETFTLQGVFLVVDESGTPIEGVTASCKVGGGEWQQFKFKSSKDASTLSDGYISKGKTINLIQDKMVHPEEGGEVFWRFSKAGYKEYSISLTMPKVKSSSQQAEYYKRIMLQRISGKEKTANVRAKDSSNAKEDLGLRCPKCQGAVKSRPGNAHDYYCPKCASSAKCSNCERRLKDVYVLNRKGELELIRQMCPICHKQW